LQTNFDYLFSIANPAILPSAIINRPFQLAVNYHDAPLPKYAGSYATSWAILNNESQHGISWHIIDDRVDAGDLLKQKLFPITPNETTYSLNIKCFEAAVSSFQELLYEIQAGRVKRKAQDISYRTFYYKHQKPLYGGFINWNLPSEEINQVCRALTFGSYTNGFATTKLLIADKLYIPVEMHSEDNNQKVGRVGEILFLNSQYIKIAANVGSLVISST